MILAPNCRDSAHHDIARTRLVEFKHQGNVLRDYEYDPNGNRRDAGNEIFAYANNNNQLTAFDNGSIAISFTFDAAGRVKKIGSTDLKYDLFNNMTEHGSGNKYTYDAANQRLRKTENGDSTYYVTNGLEVLAEYDENDNLQAEHIYGLGRMLAKFDSGGERTFFYTDHLGSTRLVSGESETSDDMRRDYYPYGEALTAAGNDDTPYTFVGKELDGATGLHYFGARYYDARIGRWYVPDALALRSPNISPFAYSFDNPIRFFDPNGDFPYTFHIRAFAPIGAFKRFGFHDDARGFTTDLNVTSRIKQSFTIDPTKKSFLAERATSDRTVSLGGEERLAVPTGSAGAIFGSEGSARSL